MAFHSSISMALPQLASGGSCPRLLYRVLLARTRRRRPDDLFLHPDQPILELSAPVSASLPRRLAGKRYAGPCGGESVNDKVEKDLSKFDWVTERASCSPPNIFKALRLQVTEDVKIRNALRPNNSPYEFSVAEHGDDFTVLRQ